MSCTSPRLAIFKGISEDGKKLMSFKMSDTFDSYDLAVAKYGRDNVFLLPCGKCEACKITKRRDWALRCACEAKYHLNNCFVTLTYDNVHLPKSLSKKHFQEFIHSLRGLGYKVRYFGCGELSPALRPHYHICLFGYIPEDLKYIGKSKSGMAMFESEELSKIWNKGFVVVNHFDPACAGYVAGYTTKKLGQEDGFILMSKKPGIGFNYANEHMEKHLKYDVVMDSLGSIKKNHVPRYFDKLAEKYGVDLSLIKAKRNDKAHVALMDSVRHFNVKSVEDVFNPERERNQEKYKKLRRSFNG